MGDVAPSGQGQAQPPLSDRQFEQVYSQLRAMAAGMLDGERGSHTLQATALVHEVWLRMLQSGASTVQDPRRYFTIAAMAMRHILVDHARRRGRKKRGGGQGRIPLDAMALIGLHDTGQILAIDEAVTKLEQSHPDLAELVQLRFFAGLSVDETAKALGQSVRTVHRDWTAARALLAAMLQDDAG